MKKINLSPIDADLETIAFKLFREWTSKDQKQIPLIKIVIDDETNIVEDLKFSITKALEVFLLVLFAPISMNNGIGDYDNANSF